MLDNFEKLLDDRNKFYDDFISKHTTLIELDNDLRVQKVIDYYAHIFDILNAPFKKSVLIQNFEELAKYKISMEVPFAVMINEISWIKSSIVFDSIQKNKNLDIINILTFFDEIINTVAHVYLLNYLDKLMSKNNIRRNSLADLSEKNLILHYEAHLIWLSNLAQHIKTKDKSKFPELDHTLCKFGKWLHGDGKKTIHNNSKYKELYAIHEKLHYFAQKIHDIIEEKEYSILITYLEKCEVISLSIGTDLSLLDQIIINKRITKDTLTGSLNRHALSDLFESQYELALATNSHFTLAMCDLDYFKNVNDTYGHIAGDQVLKLFVKIVKKNIRSSDMIIRYGGEEFIIILPTIDKKKGFLILEKIREEFAQTELIIGKEAIKATVSMGMMEIQPEKLFRKEFTDEYIMIVDKNLYMAKEDGRNKIKIY